MLFTWFNGQVNKKKTNCQHRSLLLSISATNHQEQLPGFITVKTSKTFENRKQNVTLLHNDKEVKIGSTTVCDKV